MNTFRTILSYLFPTEEELYQRFKRILPIEPPWLEPLSWVVALALILGVCALIFFQVYPTS